jgi:hypothetical protein
MMARSRLSKARGKFVSDEGLRAKANDIMSVDRAATQGSP